MMTEIKKTTAAKEKEKCPLDFTLSPCGTVCWSDHTKIKLLDLLTEAQTQHLHHDLTVDFLLWSWKARKGR